MECLYFHFIENAFWNISFGSYGYGIYQFCPPENLHTFKEGQFTYLLKGLMDQQSGQRKLQQSLIHFSQKYQIITIIKVIAIFHA